MVMVLSWVCNTVYDIVCLIGVWYVCACSCRDARTSCVAEHVRGGSTGSLVRPVRQPDGVYEHLSAYRNSKLATRWTIVLYVAQAWWSWCGVCRPRRLCSVQTGLISTCCWAPTKLRFSSEPTATPPNVVTVLYRNSLYKPHSNEP